MSAFALRLTACLCMLLDHVGFLRNIELLRIVGRAAMPIYAFQIAEGFRHTHSRGKYLLRLGILAVVSEIPFALCFFGGMTSAKSHNVFFTLALGLCALWVGELLTPKTGKWLAAAVGFLLCGALAKGIRCDYEAYGVALVVFWGLLPPPDTVSRRGIAALGLTALVLLHTASLHWSHWALVNLWELAALVPILLYNGAHGFPEQDAPKALQKAVQWGFYLFYPVHLLLLYAFLG